METEIIALIPCLICNILALCCASCPIQNYNVLVLFLTSLPSTHVLGLKYIIGTLWTMSWFWGLLLCNLHWASSTVTQPLPVPLSSHDLSMWKYPHLAFHVTRATCMWMRTSAILHLSRYKWRFPGLGFPSSYISPSLHPSHSIV